MSIAPHNEVFDPDRERIIPRRGHVFALVSFARTIYWDRTNLTKAYLLRFVASWICWRGRPNTLRADRARWLGDRIHQGLVAAGYSSSQHVPVNFGPSGGV